VAECASAGFVLGVNLPWVRYGDFGSNAWHPRGGLASTGDLAALGSRLRHLRDVGITALRWFVFCDGRAGIEYDTRGVPRGLDDAVWRDLDAALAVTADAELRLVPVLFDFHWCGRRRVVRGVQLGGRTAVLEDADARDALLQRVVDPVLDRYGREPVILAWDVFNEPEWATFAAGTWRPWRSLSRARMREWLRQLVDRVHARTLHLATVGSASARWLDLVRGIGLDVYQPHWYDHLEPRAPLATPLSRFALDGPAWLGEFPTRAGRRTAAEVCDAARRAGFAGAFAWSLLADDEASWFADAEPGLIAWAAAVAGERGGPGPDTARADDIPGTALQDGAPERQERDT
jgi:hypothetical protein